MISANPTSEAEPDEDDHGEIALKHWSQPIQPCAYLLHSDFPHQKADLTPGRLTGDLHMWRASRSSPRTSSPGSGAGGLVPAQALGRVLVRAALDPGSDRDPGRARRDPAALGPRAADGLHYVYGVLPLARLACSPRGRVAAAERGARGARLRGAARRRAARDRARDLPRETGIMARLGAGHLRPGAARRRRWRRLLGTLNNGRYPRWVGIRLAVVLAALAGVFILAPGAQAARGCPGQAPGQGERAQLGSSRVRAHRLHTRPPTV